MRGGVLPSSVAPHPVASPQPTRPGPPRMAAAWNDQGTIPTLAVNVLGAGLALAAFARLHRGARFRPLFHYRCVEDGEGGPGTAGADGRCRDGEMGGRFAGRLLSFRLNTFSF